MGGNMVVGQIVCSRAGKDKGCFSVIMKITENRVYIANGKSVKLKKPKLKNPKHLSLTKTVLEQKQLLTNKRLRKALATFTRP